MAKADEAHLLTEKELAKLERRIAKLYRDASKEMQTTIDDYFSSFAKRDEEMQSLIGSTVNGKEWTERDYKQWRLNQIGRGKRLEALRDKLAERVTQANETAVAYTNDTTPGIYSLNRNYTAYTIEQVSDAADFTLWDEQTVKRLAVERPDLMPYYPKKQALKRGIDLEYGKKQITASITSSILQGKSIKGIADDLQGRITTMSRASAIRTARTAVTGAQNAGRMDSYKAAEGMGIKLKKQWLSTLDNRTRHAHAMLDGQTVDTDKPFKVDGYELMYPGDRSAPGYLVYNCRCTTIAVLPDVDTSDAQRWARDPETGERKLVSDMSYQEWAGWKKKEQKTVPQRPILEYRTPQKEDYSRMQKESKKAVSKEDIAQITGHTKADGSPGGYVATHNYSKINSNMRIDGYTGDQLDEDDFKTIDSMRRAISSYSLDDNYTMTRYVNADYISSVFGIQTKMWSKGKLENIADSITRVGNPYVVKEAIPEITRQLQERVGTCITEKAFVSASVIPSKNIMQDKSVMFEINAKKGTNCFVTSNRKESECIFMDNSKLYLTGVRWDDSVKKWILTAEIE